MFDQFVKLYENNVGRGTLLVSVDESKFLLKFFDSIKVELLLEDNITHGRSDISNSNTGSYGNTSSNTLVQKLGDYIDLSELSASKKLPVLSLKPVIAEDSQYPTISIADGASLPKNKASLEILNEEPEPIGVMVNHVNDGTRNSKKRKIANASKNNKKPSVNLDSFMLEINRSSDVSGVVSDFSLAEGNYEVIDERFRIPTVCKNSKFPTFHECRDCYERFASQQALLDHKKIKIVKEYHCDECLETFEYQAFLEVHKRANHGNSGASLVYKDNQYWYSCDECGSLAVSILELQIHHMKHTGEGIYQCCRCQEKFVEKEELGVHMKRHKQSSMTKCRWCQKWFPDYATLWKHKRHCREIKCHLCDNVFPNRASRNKHYKDFHPHDILRCHLCRYLFSSQADLDEHIAKHSKSKKQQCPLCGLLFTNLKLHMLTHKNPEERKEHEFYYCDQCPARYSNPTTFGNHRKKHTGEKLYQCPNCPRSFYSNDQLYKHIKRHKPLLPFACEVCGENFASSDQLKSHIKTHSKDDFLFPCSVCTQSFMYKKSLEAHMQMKHGQTYAGAEIVEIDNIDNAIDHIVNTTAHDYRSSGSAIASYSATANAFGVGIVNSWY